MAKQLVFTFDGQESSFGISKVDRSKLYGYKESLVLDENQSVCSFAVLAEDGSTVVGGGDVGMGYLTADGEWSSKTELTPVDIEGTQIQPVRSSFEAPIDLLETVDINQFLAHNIRLIYVLENSKISSNLKSALTDQKIFRFPYSYRGGLQADTGFLLQGADEEFYLLVGDEMQIDFVGLREVASPVPDESEVGETDFMDFDMI